MRDVLRSAVVCLVAGLAQQSDAWGQVAAIDIAPAVQPVAPGQGDPSKSPDQAELDKKALASANLKPDDTEGLIKYLKSRTLNDVDLTKIQALIAKLGDDVFRERIKAEAELEKIGNPAIAPLRLAAQNDSNSHEIIYRAKSCLRRLEKVPSAEVAGAVVRALAKLKNPDVVPALLAYLPLADSVSVIDEIRNTLTASAVRDGKPEQVLVDAITDKNAIRRTMAICALIEASKGKPLDIYPKLAAAAVAETDASAKFDMAKAMVLAAKDKAGVALILDAIPEMNRGQIWQTEDLLAQLAAGKEAPKVRFLKSKDSLVKAQTAWKDWWKTNQEKLDWDKLALKQRILGRFVTISHDYRFGQQGVITEFGSDEKERWKMTGLLFPTDVAFTDNGRVWVTDQNASQVTERDLAGKVLSTRKFEIDNGGWKGPAQPTNLQLLDNGGMLVVARNGVCEFDKTGKEVVKYARTQQVQGWGNQDVISACKLQNGQIAISVMNNGPNGQNPQIIFVDEKGKEVKTKDDKGKEINKFVKTGFSNNYGGSLIETSKDRVLLSENNRLVEYDLTTGKEVWEKKGVNNSRCLQRLPNGNVLYIDGNIYPNKAVEITPEGEEVWSYQIKDNNVNLYRVIIR